jgi:protoporphyrinogen oxidase
LAPKPLRDPDRRTTTQAHTLRHVVIIGGGFTGLAAACSLVGPQVRPAKKCASPIRVTIIEKASQLGGLAAGFKDAEWESSLEHFYHHWFTSDQWVRFFAHRWVKSRISAGGSTEPRLWFRRVSSALEVPGNLVFTTKKSPSPFWVLDSPLSLLRFQPLPFLDRLRMAAALCYLKLVRNGVRLEHHTAEEWCLRWMGHRAYNTVWKGLLEGKFGTAAGSVNMAWLWARIHSRTQALGSYAGGFQQLVTEAAESLKNRGVHIERQCGNLTISRHQNSHGYRIETGSGLSVDCDAVLFATSPHELVKHLCPDSAYAARIAAQRALGAIVCILSLKRPLSGPSAGHYWYSLRKSLECPFLAIVHHTAFVPPEHFAGEHLYYVADYLPSTTDRFHAPDQQIVAEAMGALRKIEPGLPDSTINRSWVFRTPYAQPIPGRGASADLLPIPVTGLNGVFLASMAQVYPWDRGTNYALEMGVKAAGAILTYFDEMGIETPDA